MCDGREENRATEAACLWELLFLSLPREGCSGFVVQKEHSFFECSCRSSQQGWDPSGMPSGLIWQLPFTPTASSGLLG